MDSQPREEVGGKAKAQSNQVNYFKENVSKRNRLRPAFGWLGLVDQYGFYNTFKLQLSDSKDLSR